MNHQIELENNNNDENEYEYNNEDDDEDKDENEYYDVSSIRISPLKDSKIFRLPKIIKYKKFPKLLNNLIDDIILYKLIPNLDNIDILRLCKISKLWYNQIL